MKTGRPKKSKRLVPKKEDVKSLPIAPSSGLTDKDIAKLYNVSENTLNEWKKKFPEWYESLQHIKDIKDGKVEASLYERACGYSHPDTNISNFRGRVTITPIVKHYPPDPTSMIFWLKNRKQKEWREKIDHEHSGKDGKPFEITYHVISKEVAVNAGKLKKMFSNGN